MVSRSETEKEIAAAAAERFGEEAAASMPPGGLLLRGNGLWIVRVGAVRLFSVMADGDGGYGKRSFLFDAGAGCVLFGPGETQERQPVAAQDNVWVVGLDNAELVPVSRSSVEALTADPALRRWLTGQVERWMEAWRQSLGGEDGADSAKALPLAAELNPVDASGWWSGLDAFHAQALTALRRLREQEALAEQARLEAGAGQAAKIVNNMLLGATMVATCEAFA
ncbi:MAG: hypothetical protein J7639_25310, partial [Paenibacillaceae bacterium]|nr:hypothetical protein [Paenibacillaceae bacterium]